MATASATRMAKVELSAVTEIPTASKMAVFGDPDGNGIRLLGYMDMGSGFLPLNGGTMTGDIEFPDYGTGLKQIVEGDSIENTQQFINDEGIIYQSTEYDNLVDRNELRTGRVSLSSFSAGLQVIETGVGVTNLSVSIDGVILQATKSGSKGFIGDTFFNKLNDANAFAQIGDIGTGFNQATLSTPQAITASTPTVITLVGATEQENGDLDLLDISTNTITPIQQGDIITVDFAFPFETPIGSLQFGYVQIREKTTGFVVREYQHTYIKGAGLDDVLSSSFIIPIGSASYVTNGFEIVINSTAAIILSSKYLVVTRTHTKK